MLVAVALESGVGVVGVIGSPVPVAVGGMSTGSVEVGDGVLVGVGLSVTVADGVTVGVKEEVGVAVNVRVGVCVDVAVADGVKVIVCV